MAHIFLTQEEFAARYHIPLGTLRDWKQGRCAPDQPARNYLTVIAHDPEGVARTPKLTRVSSESGEIATHLGRLDGHGVCQGDGTGA